MAERHGAGHDDLAASFVRLRQISAELEAMRQNGEQEKDEVARLNREAEMVKSMLGRLHNKWQPLL
jgi:hypothetical protein